MSRRRRPDTAKTSVGFGPDALSYRVLRSALSDDPMPSIDALASAAVAEPFLLQLMAVAGVALHRVAALEGRTPAEVLDEIAQGPDAYRARVEAKA